MIKNCLTVVVASMAGVASSAQAQPAEAPVPAPKPAIAATAAQVSTAASTYRINAGDELEIYVWGEERLQRKVKVLPDGTMAFPLVGQIKVQGFLSQRSRSAHHQRTQRTICWRGSAGYGISSCSRGNAIFRDGTGEGSGILFARPLCERARGAQHGGRTGRVR